MNRNEIVDILKLIQADNHRTLGEVDVALWQTVIGHLDFADARAAVFARIGSPPDGSWTRPGHIKILVAEIAKDRWLRTNPDERNELGQLDTGEPVNEAAAPARAAAIGLFAGNAGQLGDPYDTCIHLPCPRCHAERDAYCTNPVTGRSARCPCLRRLKAAEVAA